MTWRAAFVYADELSRHTLRDDHPMKPIRLRHTYELLQAYGAFDRPDSRLVKPRPATEEELRWVHTPEYIGAVRSLSLGLAAVNPARYGFDARGDNPIVRGMHEAALLSSGASMVAAELVAGGQVPLAFNISGGLHHAARGHASGFCVYNDPAIAIHYFLKQGKRVAYVDIDAHHGDGVQAAFYGANRVLTISTHESGRYLFPGSGFVTEIGEGEGAGYSVNVPLFPYTGDDVFLWAFHETVIPLVKAFAPDVLVTQLGVDTYCRDPITHLQLTTRGFTAAVQEFSKLGLPWLALGGGGYELGAVARCWALAYGVMLGVAWPDEIPAACAQQHQTRRLRDAQEPEISEEIRAETRRFAEESVAAVKRLIFPYHGLAG